MRLLKQEKENIVKCNLQGVASCEQSGFTVATSHDGEYAVQVLVHSPKALQGTARPCLVYAHGGGAIAGKAEQYTPYLSFMAANCGIIVFRSGLEH